MAKFRKNLAKLPQLVTFAAACRNRNFTRTAEELGVSRVYVSRQISELEQAIGAKLFLRNHRKVTLTQAGHMLAAEAVPALNQIAGAFQRISEMAGDSRLTVTTTSAFATYWLMPRLIDFSNRCPDIELNLVVSDRKLDLTAEGIDIAIRYSKEPPNEGEITPLFQECVFPVVSPKYSTNTSLTYPADLLNENLLHLSGIYRPGARWPNWFHANGLEHPPEPNGVVFNTYINMLQAAIGGQGIALAGSPLIDPYLEDGSLIKLEGFLEIKREFFYLINTTNKREDADSFCSWLLEMSLDQKAL